MKNSLSFVALILISVSFNVHSEVCESKLEIPKGFYFPKIFEASKLLSKELCLIATTESTPDYSAAKPIADKWKKIVDNESNELKKANINIDEHTKDLYSEILNGRPFAAFSIDKGKKVTFDVNGGNLQVVKDNDKCKTLSYQQSCYEVLKQLQVALNASIDSVKVIETNDVIRNLGIYSKQWDRYFDDARSQTFLELSFNTWLYRDELKKNEFVIPPSYQIALFHPSVVIEYISDADNGDKNNEALAIEWIGINWWGLKVPLGVSLVTTYSDRSSVGRVGYGLMFHINNDYSIGVTDHDGYTGIFVTVDFLKLVQGKERQFNDYRDKVAKIRN